MVHHFYDHPQQISPFYVVLTCQKSSLLEHISTSKLLTFAKKMTHRTYAKTGCTQNHDESPQMSIQQCPVTPFRFLVSSFSVHEIFLSHLIPVSQTSLLSPADYLSWLCIHKIRNSAFFLLPSRKTYFSALFLLVFLLRLFLSSPCVLDSVSSLLFKDFILLIIFSPFLLDHPVSTINNCCVLFKQPPLPLFPVSFLLSLYFSLAFSGKVPSNWVYIFWFHFFTPILSSDNIGLASVSTDPLQRSSQVTE